MRFVLHRPAGLALVLAICATVPGCKRGPKHPPLVVDDDLGEAFEAAAVELKVGDAEPPRDPLRWQPPGCELEYEFRVNLSIDMLEPESRLGQSGLWIGGGFTVRAEGERMILRNTDVTIAHLRDGMRRPGGVEPTGNLAEVRLETDGLAWTEVDGPTALWSAYGSWSGLVDYFPTLPDATEPGARATWALLHHAQGSGMRVEAERGGVTAPEGAELPEPEGDSFEVAVELVRHVELDGVRAMVLRSRGDESGGGPLGGGGAFGMLAGVKAELTTMGQFVVLDSGVLLHAELRDRARVEMGRGKVEMTQLHTTNEELRLVRGCGGPVLPRFVDARSPGERALDGVTAIRNHAVADELDEVEARLAPALRTAHPEAGRCLLALVDTYGPRALGMPELPVDERIDVQGDRAWVDLRANFDASDGQQHGRLDLAFDVSGETAKLVSPELRGRDQGEMVLWLEPDRPLLSSFECVAPPE